MSFKVYEFKYKYYISITTCFIISLLFSVSCYKNFEDDISSDSIDHEMGHKLEITYNSWDSVDPHLKEEFEKVYDNSRIKRPVFEQYFNIIGPYALLDFLEKRYSLCHSQAHDLGKVIYSRIKDINQSLSICGNRCTNACMHGVVSEAFGNKDLDEVISLSKTFCETDQMDKLHKKGNCMHGLGHAFMIVTGHDLGNSINACDEFADKTLSYYCSTGVFMEYRDNLRNTGERLPVSTKQDEHSHHNHHSKMFSDSMTEEYSDFYPCDKYNKYPAACYRYMFPLIRSKLNIDRTELTNRCMKLPAIERRGCFHGLGLMYIVSVSRKPSNITILCDSGDYEDKVMCIEGVIEKLSDMKESAAFEACSALEGELANVCKSAAEEKMYRLNKPTMGLYLQ